MNKKQILIIEDNREIRSLLKDMLTRLDYEVATAATAKEAIKRMNGHTFDVIIADIRLPGMNADELFELTVGERPELADRFIFTTGESVDSSVTEFIRRKPNRCVYKPFRLSDIQEAVDATIQQTLHS